jgi:TRAP-type mannitol/chloroaromatic compound transport system permease large subunit
MLSLIVVVIMLGFPTAFTLMGLGMVFGFGAFYEPGAPWLDNKVFNLMVQRAFGAMTNDTLLSIPLFVLMGYVMERGALVDKMFHSVQLAFRRLPGSLAVATLVICTFWGIASGLVGAVVVLMGVIAMRPMLNAGYDTRLAAGVITAGGTLGILIPPSVMLIVYGATAGVSVVKLYAGAFFPGIMLATLYVIYVVVLAKIKPHLAPPMSAEDRIVPLPAFAQVVSKDISNNVLPGLIGALKGKRNAAVPMRELLNHLAIALLPALAVAAIMGTIYFKVTAPLPPEVVEGVVAMGGELADSADTEEEAGSVSGLAEPEADGLQTPPGSGETAKAASDAVTAEPAKEQAPAVASAVAEAPVADAERQPAPTSFWVGLASCAVALALFYAYFSFARLEIFKMLLGSFFPLALMILAVLGTIVFGLATPTEAAAMGSLGGLLLAAAYRRLNYVVLRESVYLTAKTSAMVCWLFVGSSIFSAAFALLGGQEIINTWVLGMDLTPVQFMILAQVVIFLLGWPLEWTEIIVIFMPIFIPLLPHFGIDPLFFGLLVALNLQTAFLSPPVAMAAFYLKGVSPPHVTLNQIFAGMLPFMAIQVLAIVLLYMFPAIGLWLPSVLYK